MSNIYKNRSSEVTYFIDFNFMIFSIFKRLVLIIAAFFQMSDTSFPSYAHTYDFVLLKYAPVAHRISL